MHLFKGPYVLVWYFCLLASFYLFSMKSIVFYALFYNDVTTSLWRHSFLDQSWWKLHSICKIRNKRHFVRENFLNFVIFIEKITINYENYVNCQVTTHLSPPPSLLGRLLGWVLLGTHLSHTWGYKKNSFYINWWKPGSIPIILLPWAPH